jgi:hypothetical protein
MALGLFFLLEKGHQMTRAKPRKKAAPQKNGDPGKNGDQRNNGGGISRIFGDIANSISQAASRASVFMLAAGTIIVWG